MGLVEFSSFTVSAAPIGHAHCAMQFSYTKMAFPVAKVYHRLFTIDSALIIRRQFSTTRSLSSRKNFRNFPYFGRGPAAHYERQKVNPHPDLPVVKFTRDVGYKNKKNEWVVVPEMIPELVVPDLEGFELKPYVTHKASVPKGPEFTALDLFEAVYAPKIRRDYEEGKLDSEGNPIAPSEEELLTPQEAELRARRTGCDIFTDFKNPVNKRENAV